MVLDLGWVVFVETVALPLDMGLADLLQALGPHTLLTTVTQNRSPKAL